MKKIAVLKVRADCKPARDLAKLVDSVLKSGKVGLKVGDFAPELVGVQSDARTASAGELVVTLYPTEGFSGLATALLTG